MRIRVGGLIELVLAFAVALAMTRAVRIGMPLLEPFNPIRFMNSDFGPYFEQMMESLALMGGLGLWVERGRRRSPPVWGFGRWCWSMTALILVLGQVMDVVTIVLPNGWVQDRGHFEMLITWPPWLRDRQIWTLFAFAITSRLAGLPRDSTPDAREWAGRLYAILLMIWWIHDQVRPLLSR